MVMSNLTWFPDSPFWGTCRNMNVRDASSQVYILFTNLLIYASPAREVIWNLFSSTTIYLVDYVSINTYITVLSLILVVSTLPQISGLILAGLFVVFAWILHIFTMSMPFVGFTRVIVSSFITSVMIYLLCALLPYSFNYIFTRMKLVMVRLIRSSKFLSSFILVRHSPRGRSTEVTNDQAVTVTAGTLRKGKQNGDNFRTSKPSLTPNVDSDLELDSPFCPTPPRGRGTRSNSRQRHVRVENESEVCGKTNPMNLQNNQTNTVRPTRSAAAVAKAALKILLGDSDSNYTYPNSNAVDDSVKFKIESKSIPTSGHDKYAIDYLSSMRVNGRSNLLEYYVIWAGYPVSEGQWTTAKDLIRDGCQEAINEFHRTHD